MQFESGLRKSLFAATLSLALCSATSFTVSASEFSDSYAAYQSAVSDKNYSDAQVYADKAYQLGKEIYPKGSLDLANLALNLGSVLEINKKQTQAFDAYSEALAIYQTHFDDDAIELIEPLIGAADTAEKPKVARKYFIQAIDIAEDADDPILLANTFMSAFNKLSKTPVYSRKIQNYAIKAFEIYEDELPEDAMARVRATYIVGMIRKSKKQDAKAIELLNKVVKQFSVLDYSHPYELASHAQLVELYEKKGLSEKSTQHCIAIGSMRPWLDTQEQVPLYRLPPKYPVNSARAGREGMVQLSFIVDESGFVTEPKVIMSEGGSGFEKESLKAIKHWRYAPKFVDGKPVAAPSTVQLDYTMAKS
ncbi:TonB family protein [Shewanella woodyi]|uniref:TonB family protein n=1 Tax=Shewanella woodyi TaxID=60961 RepID=UPI0007F86DAA|nr:TonB family protein [Shewanella woodyi]